MELLGVERLDTKKRRAEKGLDALAKIVTDEIGADISKALAGGADEKALDEAIGTKYMAAKAVLGGEDRGPATHGSPREMPEDV